jgi:restriction system protein
MRAAHQQVDAELRSELIERIVASPPSFFERLVVRLLVAMGYGGSVANAGRALGRSGDGGVDGVIDQDALGLDRVYIQAKRYTLGNNVGASAVGQGGDTVGARLSDGPVAPGHPGRGAGSG